MKRDFESKHVLITGAGSGIGRATAIAFAHAGASLELVDVASGGLEETAASCRELGRVVHTHVCDVADAHAMKCMAEKVHARIAALDVLMNNAGVGVAGDFVGTELAVWDWAIGINVKGVIHGCHYFVPQMIERARAAAKSAGRPRTGGHIINVASAAGLVAPKNMSVYSTTKFAVVGLSEALRLELRDHKIGVTTLCPGVINTPITRNTRLTGKLAHQAGLQDRIVKLYERRNYGPERVASAVLEAVRKRKKVVPVAPEAWAMYYGKRLSPALMELLMGRDAPV